MLCQFLKIINSQNSDNSDFWRISLEDYYEQLVEAFRMRKVSFYMPSSERISAPDSYILYGGYVRELIIDIQQVQNEDGNWEYREIVISKFRIQRILDKNSNKTQAILNSLFVPYKQYSLRYVLYYLQQFFNQYRTQEEYTMDMKAERTFRIWLKWLRDHITVLRKLGLTCNYIDNWQILKQWIGEIFSDLPKWSDISLQKINLGLFQDHLMPENTKYQNYVRAG